MAERRPACLSDTFAAWESGLLALIGQGREFTRIFDSFQRLDQLICRAGFIILYRIGAEALLSDYPLSPQALWPCPKKPQRPHQGGLFQAKACGRGRECAARRAFVRRASFLSCSHNRKAPQELRGELYSLSFICVARAMSFHSATSVSTALARTSGLPPKVVMPC